MLMPVPGLCSIQSQGQRNAVLLYLACCSCLVLTVDRVRVGVLFDTSTLDQVTAVGGRDGATSHAFWLILGLVVLDFNRCNAARFHRLEGLG